MWPFALKSKKLASGPLPLEEVLQEEEDLIHSLSSGETAERSAKNSGHTSEELNVLLHRLRKRRSQEKFYRFALAFSGGGIRSACINLGVAQGLAGRQLLRKFHFLSTVSGGGYIGGWLSTWLMAARRKTQAANPGQSSAAYAQAALSTVETAMAQRPAGNEAAEIRNLRTNSNYLTPRMGAFSVDLFACLTTIARNLLVNWLVLIPFFAFCLMVPMVIMLAGSWLTELQDRLVTLSVASLAIVFILINAGIAIGIMPVFKRGAVRDKSSNEIMSPLYVWLMYVRWASVFLAAFALAIWLGQIGTDGNLRLSQPSAFLLGGNWWPVYLIILIPYLTGIRRAFASSDVEVNRGAFFYWVKIFIGFAIPAMATYCVARGLLPVLLSIVAKAKLFGVPLDFPHTPYLAIAPAAFLIIIELENFLMIGCLSMLTDDEDREWWSRSNAITILFGLGWLAASLIVVFSPLFCSYLAAHRTQILTALAAQFSLGTIVSLFATSTKTPATTRDRPAPVRMALLKAGGIAFFVILAVLLAAANFGIAKATLPYFASPANAAKPDSVTASLSHNLENWGTLAIFTLALTLGISAVVNINQFSIQCLYRNRLLRCFIGAVRRVPGQVVPPDKREPEPFTGFDTTDNYDVSDLKGQLPFHVINMAQNLIKPTNLAWQERMADSFTASPLHTGGPLTQYRPTDQFGGGLSIGTAVATSGAAANPSMGHCTSSMLELLMGLFNVRLGWWVGSPDDKHAWRRIGPQFALQPLLSELLGLTSEGQEYVLLSDGGHFEDLGIYEMVRRRCRFLVAVDGGADPDGTFEDLGNAVRKIRIDFGIDVQFLFNFTTPRLCKDKKARQHFAVAKILYSAVDQTQKQNDGWILYIKGCLNGDEPEDIYQYKRFYKDFPHQTTLDQWFDESQFESYRTLGRHSIEKALDALKAFNPGAVANPHCNAFAGQITNAQLGNNRQDFLDFISFLKSEAFI